MNGLDRDALDRWITSPRYSEDTTTAYCHNKDCKLFGDEQTVDTYREYGRTYWKQDECAACGKDLEEDRPEDDDDDDL